MIRAVQRNWGAGIVVLLWIGALVWLLFPLNNAVRRAYLRSTEF